MSEYEPVSIPDFGSTERKVGAVEDADNVFHQTVAPVNLMLKSQGSITLSGTATDITIEPGANWLLVDLGEADWNATFSALKVSGAYTSGGAWHSIPVFTLSPFGALAGGWPGAGDHAAAANTLSFNEVTAFKDGSSVLWIPTTGMTTVRLQTFANTHASVTVKQLIGSPPFSIDQTPKGPHIAVLSEEWAYDGSLYSSGECIGGSLPLIDTGYRNNHLITRVVPKFVNIVIGDWEETLTDFDVVITSPDAFAYVDHDTADFDSIADVYGFWQVRSTPSGDQRRTISLGAFGGTGVVMNDISCRGGYVLESASPDPAGLWFADLHIVARASTTFSGVGNGEYKVVVEF